MRKLLKNLCVKIIPNTARNDSWNEILNNSIGSMHKKTKAVTNKIFSLSFENGVNLVIIKSVSIVATLRADGVNPTMKAIIQQDNIEIKLRI